MFLNQKPSAVALCKYVHVCTEPAGHPGFASVADTIKMCRGMSIGVHNLNMSWEADRHTVPVHLSGMDGALANLSLCISLKISISFYKHICSYIRK